jgi:hypothetical protein
MTTQEAVEAAEFIRDAEREDGITRTSWSLQRVLDEERAIQHFERIYGCYPSIPWGGV